MTHTGLNDSTKGQMHCHMHAHPSTPQTKLLSSNPGVAYLWVVVSPVDVECVLAPVQVDSVMVEVMLLLVSWQLCATLNVMLLVLLLWLVVLVLVLMLVLMLVSMLMLVLVLGVGVSQWQQLNGHVLWSKHNCLTSLHCSADSCTGSSCSCNWARAVWGAADGQVARINQE